MLNLFLTAVALLLVLEGVLPFLSPSHWRKMMLRISRTNDRSLRIIGLASMLFGTALICIIHLLGN